MVSLGKILYLIAISRTILFFVAEFYRAAIRKEKQVRKIYKKWAIVTGCTGGIGRAYCFELAKRGFNLVLLSRNEEKLKNLEIDILKQSPKIKIMFKMVDFAKFKGEQKMEMIEFLGRIKGEIGILINNVGLAYNNPEYYSAVPLNRRDDLVEVNVLSTKSMIDIVLPMMLSNKLENSHSRKGAIINISSYASISPSALSSLYSATKSFIDKFTTGLYNEYKNKKIDFQSQHPLLVATAMTRMRPKRFVICSPEQYASAAVGCIGYGPIEIPHWYHKVQSIILSYIPFAVQQKLVFTVFLKMREIALKKKSK